MLNIQQNISLKNYSTMKLGGVTKYLIEINNRDDLSEALSLASKNNLETIMIGGGSNIIWSDDGFNGILLINKILGIRVFNEDEENIFMTIGAGENWDEVVKKSTELNFTGIEALSLIPGSAGSTVIQNVGAYGQEISQTLINVEVFDKTDSQYKIISATDCKLAYRTSIFKDNPKNPYLITALTLNLKKTKPADNLYPAIKEYFDQNNINEINPTNIREAVISIRQSRLPDPTIIPNNGSFFTNPTINFKQFFTLQRNLNQTIPHWKVDDDNVKIPAAWLIEYCGLKDFHDPSSGFATWKNQALVIINETGTSTNQLIIFRNYIIDVVYKKTGIKLTQEPQILPQIAG